MKKKRKKKKNHGRRNGGKRKFPRSSSAVRGRGGGYRKNLRKCPDVNGGNRGKCIRRTRQEKKRGQTLLEGESREIPLGRGKSQGKNLTQSTPALGKVWMGFLTASPEFAGGKRKGRGSRKSRNTALCRGGDRKKKKDAVPKQPGEPRKKENQELPSKKSHEGKLSKGNEGGHNLKKFQPCDPEKEDALNDLKNKGVGLLGKENLRHGRLREKKKRRWKGAQGPKKDTQGLTGKRRKGGSSKGTEKWLKKKVTRGNENLSQRIQRRACTLRKSPYRCRGGNVRLKAQSEKGKKEPKKSITPTKKKRGRKQGVCTETPLKS